MRHDELIKALNEMKPLWWNDPDPIEGRNYSIERVTILHGEDLEDEEICAHIELWDGGEATVYISEIILK